jgi:sulfur-oxidizing protein SoxY
MRRRRFIQFLLETSLGSWFLAHGGRLVASQTDSPLLIASDEETHFNSLIGNHPLVDNPDIHLILPSVAENGAVVPLTITSDLEGIDKVMIWVEKNPNPLVARFELSTSVALYITARIKMAESCPVTVVAHQGERWLRCQQWVQVMQGGCGSG